MLSAERRLPLDGEDGMNGCWESIYVLMQMCMNTRECQKEIIIDTIQYWPVHLPPHRPSDGVVGAPCHYHHQLLDKITPCLSEVISVLFDATKVLM